MQKILIVDDGSRTGARTLSAELAELGYASVTTAVEATDEVLAMMGDPAAVIIDMPQAGGASYPALAALAARLRSSAVGAEIPIIEVDSRRPGVGAPINLRGRIGTRTLNEPAR